MAIDMCFLFRLLASWICFVGFACGSLDAAHSKSSTEREISGERLSDLIQKIASETSTTQRTEYAYHLRLRIEQTSLDNLDESTITDIAALLEDRDDSVRAWAAASLGVIGLKANNAIPALLKALNDIECSPGSLTSEPMIRVALAKMGQYPPQRECPSIE